MDDFSKNSLMRLKRVKNKKRIEDTHTRRTFLIRNDLLEQLDAVSKGAHGFKIEFINIAIESALEEYINTDFDRPKK